METLQFINAKISHVSQNNLFGQENVKQTNEKAADRLVNRLTSNQCHRVSFSLYKKVINALLEIDHLILNVFNIFTEQHFSFETQKLSGQLYVLLVINPTQYAIEASLKEIRLVPSNIIDRSNVRRKTVRGFFHLLSRFFFFFRN